MHSGGLGSLMKLMNWLSRHWEIFFWATLMFINGKHVAFRQRQKLLEGKAGPWPAVDGRARCSLLPAGLGAYRLNVRGVVSWDHPDGSLTRTFSSKAEADYYRAALQGRTVQVHTNPRNAKESSLVWSEVTAGIPAYVSLRQGRLTPKGYAGAKVFCGVAAAGFAAAVADVGMFATPWGRNLEWHRLCLCDLSLLLLMLGLVLLAPAAILRVRLGELAETIRMETEREFWRRGTVWLSAAAAAIWVAGVCGAMASSPAPDWVFYVMMTAPVFPLLWRALGVGVRAVRELRPLTEVARISQPENLSLPELRDDSAALPVSTAV